MRILITAGPTREPIDAVRYIGNRSSGKMGAALAEAAIRAKHQPALILGPVSHPMPPGIRRIDVQTAAEMSRAVLDEFPAHDLLIMAAAVADFRPSRVVPGKIARDGKLSIECEATEDILAIVGGIKRPDQRTVGFSLESAGNIQRATEKLRAKKLDLIVYNPIDTIGRDSIECSLLFADGRVEHLGCRTKVEVADILIQKAVVL